MSIPKPDLHLRLSDEAMVALAAIAESEGRNKAEMAQRVLEEGLLGKAHVLKLAADRLRRVGLFGRDGA